MNKRIALIAVTACLSAQTYAKNMSIETNPLGLAIGIFNGTFLYDVSDNLSVGPSVSYWNFGLSGDDITLLSASARAEYMPSGNKIPGLYVAGSGNYTSFSATVSEESATCDATVGALGAVATAGYKFISMGGFVAKVGAGYSLGSVGNLEGSCSDGTNYSENINLPYGGLAFEWSLGYKF